MVRIRLEFLIETASVNFMAQSVPRPMSSDKVLPQVKDSVSVPF